MSSNNQNNNDQVTRIENKLDALHASLDSIDKTLVRQEEQLIYHIKRTDLLQGTLAEVENDIKPIQRHVNMVEGGLKLFGILCMIVGLIATIYKLMGK